MTADSAIQSPESRIAQYNYTEKCRLTGDRKQVSAYPVNQDYPSIRLLGRVDQLHAGGIVSLLFESGGVDGHKEFDRRVGIEFKHVPAYGTAVRSAEYRVHMDDGYAIVGRDIADQRNNLDLLRDRDAVVHLLGKV